MQHGAAGEMAAEPIQRQPGRNLVVVAVLADRRTGARNPLQVRGGHEHRDIVQPAAPLQLHAEHVRVTRADRQHLADRLDPAHGLIVDEARRIPQHATGVGADHERALPDPDLRLGLELQQPGLELTQGDPPPVVGELVERRPVLPVARDPLALISADRTDAPIVGVLDATSGADPDRVSGLGVHARGEYHMPTGEARPVGCVVSKLTRASVRAATSEVLSPRRAGGRGNLTKGRPTFLDPRRYRWIGTTCEISLVLARQSSRTAGPISVAVSQWGVGAQRLGDIGSLRRTAALGGHLPDLNTLTENRLQDLVPAPVRRLPVHRHTRISTSGAI